MTKHFRALALLLAALAALLWHTPQASAGITCTLPFTLQNGQRADATSVMSNFNALATCFAGTAAAGVNNDITALDALATPILNGQLYPMAANTEKCNSTGSVGSPQDCARPYVVVTDPAYGAKCDGVTDDSTAINAAVAAVQANGGGNVVFPAGKTCVHTGTISITVSGVWLSGAGTGQQGSTLLFKNGSSDSIDFGFQGSQVNGGGIRNLYINHSSKTGGTAVSLQNVGLWKMENTFIDHAWNGMLVVKTNTIEVIFSVINAVTSGNTYGVKYFNNATNGDRSDVFTLIDTVIEMNHSGGTCFQWDGPAHDVHTFYLSMLGCDYGVDIFNSASSTSSYPSFGEFHGLETDGIWHEGVRIRAGSDFVFDSTSDMDAINSTTATDVVFEVQPDTGLSVTRQIQIIGAHIHDGPGGIALINAKDVVISGATLSDGGHQATNTYPALEIGANADRVVITGSKLGLEFGQGFSSNYGLQIDSGAAHVLAAANNYIQLSGTGGINNLAGNGFTNLGGGYDFNGDAIGPSLTWGGRSGNDTLQLFNAGTTSTTRSQFNLATGTGNSFFAQSLADGATPTVTISTGSAVTGGININPSASAPVSISTAIRVPAVAIASLPTCNAGMTGARATVNNGSAPTYLGTVGTTGAITVGVFCNGSNWLYD